MQNDSNTEFLIQHMTLTEVLSFARAQGDAAWIFAEGVERAASNAKTTRPAPAKRSA